MFSENVFLAWDRLLMIPALFSVQVSSLVSSHFYSSQRVSKVGQGGPGLRQYLEQRKQVRFLQTDNQGSRHLFLTVFWDLGA